MTNNDKDPVFGFMLMCMMVLLIFTNITVNSNSLLIARALKILEESFSESTVYDKDIAGAFQNPTDNAMILSESGSSEDLSW